MTKSGAAAAAAKRDALAGPAVPVIYLLITLEQAAARGVAREELLRNTGIAAEQLEDPAGYVPIFDYGRIVHRVLEKTGNRGLGYDFGLRANLRAQGMPGFGMMNSRTLREAACFGLQYFSKLRAPGFTVNAFVEGDDAVADVREAIAFGPLRRYAFDVVIVTMTHIAQQFVDPSELVMWFDIPEPDYYAQYRDRLPPAKFSTGVNQLRCPAKHLERRFEMASPLSKRLVVQQCERELALLDAEEPVSRVRAVLGDTRDGYPDLEQIASRLAMSGRTLKRRLREHGFTFRQLLDEVRCRDSIRLLKETNLTVEGVAYKLGYTEAGNFSRAFRKWTGTSPAAFRKNGAPHVSALGHRSPVNA
jgi:AraC-like DNA-binding protein